MQASKIGKMKKTPSEDLFRLIQSLNKGEKRNFKLLAKLFTTEKDKKYLELFDAIDRQGEYDQRKLGRSMQHLYGGQLSVGKNYLYKLILKSLVHYRYVSGNELATMVEQVKILYEKELYTQATKLLKKALVIATDNEDFEVQYTLLKLEGDILMVLQSERYLVLRVEENARRISDLLGQQRNWEELQAIRNKLVLIRKAHRLRRRGVLIEEANLIRENPLVKDQKKALSKRALLEWLNIQRLLSSFDDDFVQSAAFCNEMIELCEQNPPLKQNSLRVYYSAIYNRCLYLLKQGEFTAGFELLDKFRAFRDEGSGAKSEFFQAYYILVIATSIQIGMPKKALQMIPEIEQEWQSLEGKLQVVHEMRLQFWIAYAYFMDNQPAIALRWINKLLTESRQENHVELMSNAKLLNIMIHLELGNFSLVESECSSVRRFFEKNARYHDFEKQMVKLARALARSGDGPEYRETLALWYQKWKLIENDPEKGIWALNPEGWLHQKVTGESMADYQKSGQFSNVLSLPF